MLRDLPFGQGSEGMAHLGVEHPFWDGLYTGLFTWMLAVHWELNQAVGQGLWFFSTFKRLLGLSCSTTAGFQE